MSCSTTLIQKLLAAVLVMTSLLLGTPASAAGQRTGKSLDHVQTGFPLLGAHAQTDCQTCHLQGVFKGTPRECVACHTQGSRIASTFKTASHPLTAMPCGQCHSSQVSWAGARFDHTGVAPGSCASCHNGVSATGKPVGHIVTTAPCDQCHRTTAWVPATFDHTGVVAGTCETCHKPGGPGTSRPGGNHPATGSCDACHTTSAWLPTTTHVNAVQGQCATCHNGTTARGVNGGHLPLTTVQPGWSCDACHTYIARTFIFNTFKHASNQVVGGIGCINCHNGSYTGAGAVGPKNDTEHQQADHVNCETCHVTNTWDPVSGNILLPARKLYRLPPRTPGPRRK